MANSKDKNGSSSQSGKEKDKDPKSRKKDDKASSSPHQASGIRMVLPRNEKSRHSGASGSSQSKSKHEEDHSKKHTATVRFICPTCGNSYAKDNDLREHIQDAHQPPRHSCDQCRQKFKRPAELRRHKFEVHNPKQILRPKSRSGKRSLFSIGTELDEPSQEDSSGLHRKFHTCPICGLPFSKRETLQNHYRVVHEK